MDGFGVGTDIVRIERFSGAEPGDHLVDRVFTEKEQEYAFNQDNPGQHLASRFAAKEAVYKAMSSFGVDAPAPVHEIEIIVDDAGVPRVSGVEEDRLSIALSISHGEEEAVATAVAYSKDR